MSAVLHRRFHQPPTLEEAQALVGGPVEQLTLRDGSQLLVHEEGLLLDLAYNPDASAIADRLIVGNALLLTGTARWLK